MFRMLLAFSVASRPLHLECYWVSLIQTLLNSCIQTIKTTDLKGPRFTEVAVMGNESSKPRRRDHVSATVSFGAPSGERKKKYNYEYKR